MSHTSLPVGSPPRLSPKNLGASGGNLATSQNNQSNGVNYRPPHNVRGADALPSLATLTADVEQTSSPSPSAYRSTGLHKLLNPPETSSPDQQRVFSSAGPRTGPNHAPILLPSYNSPRGRKRGESHSPRVAQDPNPNPQTARRILTPRSPGLRAASLGAHQSPSMGPHIRAQTIIHGPEGRGYTMQPGNHPDAAVPPLPQAPPPPHPPPPATAARGPLPPIRAVDSNIHNPAQQPLRPPPFADNYVRPPSSGAFGPQATSYGQQRSISPTTYNAETSLEGPPSLPSDHKHSFLGLHGSGSGQNTPLYQPGWKLALETGSGQEVVDINIDYQQASKMADEKRRRNAGASARFRARRKEKEKESSQMIAGLQQELRELAEDRDFYLSERNYIRDLFLRSNAGPLPTRPASPRVRRVPTMPHPNAEAGLEYGHRDSMETPMQRQHTGDYHSPFATSPNPNMYNTQYAGSNPSFTHPPTTTPYPPKSQAPGIHPPPPPPPLAPTRAPETNSFHRDILGRWNPSQP